MRYDARVRLLDRTVRAVAAVLATVTLAHADVDIPKADALFAEAIALKSSDPAAACTKFEASLALNPQALGTLLNVALCDEQGGRIASAVVKFTEARDRAQEQSLPEYVKAADDHLTALRPELPYLAIHFAAPPHRDTKLLVGDRVVALDGRTDLTALAVDPGTVTLAVSQPGRVTYEAVVVIAKRERKRVDIPTLHAAVVVKNRRSAIGKITLGAGIATVAAGVAIGYLAKGDYDELFEGSAPLCNVRVPEAMIECTVEGRDRANDARTLGNIGTVVGVIGAAAIVTGAVLWFTAPSARQPRERTVRFFPTLTTDSAGLTALGRF